MKPKRARTTYNPIANNRVKENSMKRLLIYIMLILTAGLLSADSVAVLEEIMKPDRVFSDKDNLYITEGVNVFIYSLKDYTLKKQFGKKGEGPQEFATGRMGLQGVTIDAQTDKLVISSMGKVSLFDKNGSFIIETKLVGGFRGGSDFQPLGEHFAHIGFASEDKSFFQVINLTDAKYNKVKELLRVKSPFQRGRSMEAMSRPLTLRTDLTCNQLVADPADGTIVIFDSTGNKLKTITLAIEKTKFTDDHKEKLINYYKNESRFKQFWEFLKDRLEYPAYLPISMGMEASNGKIYILSFIRTEKDSQFLVYDKTGKLLKTKSYPFLYKNFSEPYPYAITNDTLYQLIENEDEEWELHITKI